MDKDENISPIFGFPIDSFENITKDCDLKLMGLHALLQVSQINNFISNIPLSFYMDVEIDVSTFWTYHYIPQHIHSKILFNIINESSFAKNYIITHNSSSTGQVFDISTVENILKINRNDTLIIDLNNNIYDISHPLFELANKFINKPLIELVDLICNAQAIVLADSSILCMALHLPIKTTKCYYVSRSSTDYSYLYNSVEDLPSHIRKFIPLPSESVIK